MVYRLGNLLFYQFLLLAFFLFVRLGLGLWHLRIRGAAATGTAHQLAGIGLGLLRRRFTVALARYLQGHRLLALARVLRQLRQIEIREQGEVLLHHRIRHLLQLGVHRERVVAQAHGVAQALAHLLHAVEAGQDRQQHAELGALAEVALQIAPHRHVELLIGAAQLEIGLDRNRVVALQQRVEELVQGDRRAGAVAVGEILLGQHLAEEFKGRSLELNLLLTHTHWDHIQGFPFFAPAYIANNQVRIIGYEGYRKGLESTLAVQMESSFFPIGLRQLPSNISFLEQREMEFHIGPVRVRSIFANHPGICVGYRLDTSSGSVAFLPDHESYARMRLHPRAGGAKGQETLDYCRAEDQKLVEFLRDVDVLILDSQYDEAEYQTHIGWGHSCYEDSVATALAAGAKHLFLFHHDPSHDDARVSRSVGHARELAASHGSELVVEAAREGLEIPVARAGLARS